MKENKEKSKKKSTSKSVNNKKKNEVKENKVKAFLTSTNFLKVIFVLLCIFVAILSVLVAKKSKYREEHPTSNMVIPMNIDSDDFSFNISAYGLADADEYVFKVTNNNSDKINDEEISYKILVENENDCTISVTRNNEKNNLITNQTSTVIDNQILGKNDLDEVYYHVKVTSKGKLENTDLIKVKVYR